MTRRMSMKPGVSIHAPVRGATFFKVTGLGLALVFQSTHPYGVRLKNRDY